MKPKGNEEQEDFVEQPNSNRSCSSRRREEVIMESLVPIKQNNTVSFLVPKKRRYVRSRELHKDKSVALYLGLGVTST